MAEQSDFALPRRAMRWRLSHRILGVNLIILLVLALALLFLDSFRNQLRDERQTQTSYLAELAATAVPKIGAEDVPRFFSAMGSATGARVRLYGSDGQLRHDSWRGTEPSYRLRDPSTQRGPQTAKSFSSPPTTEISPEPSGRNAPSLPPACWPPPSSRSCCRYS